VVKRTLVTGASGFVGRHLIRGLLASGHTDILALVGEQSDVELCVPTNKVDLLKSDLDTIIRQYRPDRIVHLAAQSSVAGSTFANGALITSSVNTHGTWRLADAIRVAAPEATVLFASTGEVYGLSFNAPAPLTELSPVLPASPYARSKYAAELVMGDRVAPSNKLIIARPLNHTGAGQDTRFVVPSLAQQLLSCVSSGQEVIRVGDLSARRDFMDVADVVDAYIALLDFQHEERACIYNICTGRTREIGEILEDLIRTTGASCEIEVDPVRFRKNEIPDTKLANDKIVTKLGWSPKRRWNDTIADVVAEAHRRTHSVLKS
jgi:GDP-4-dehydro-6-deoxy-D-mannose reductase